ncbi:MAG: hypothetical protein HQL88_04055 [Magnetococcales bacterium]|nr:hypothetical protein [Magnetococcales bacterium]
MVSALSESAATGASTPQHYTSVAVTNVQIRTNDAEQVQTNNVERLPEEGTAVLADRAAERARLDEILRQRSTQVRAEERSAESDRISQEQAAALLQRMAESTASGARDGAVATGNVQRLDVAA